MVDGEGDLGREVAERVVGERGEVDDGVEAVEVLGGDVADVGLAGGQLGDVAERVVGEQARVEPDRLVAGRLQQRGQDGADVAVVAGDEDLHSTRSAISRASASEEVAAGEGALRTWSARSVSETTKSSIRLPSRPSAWARTPAGPGRTSSGVSSGM